MEQNMVGRVRLKVRGQRGATIHLRHAEALQPDGKLYTENLRGARQTDHYTLSGNGEETWEPRFTFHGFRYLEITSTMPFEVTDATGVVLYSDIPEAGEFECSSALINQLQKNIQWGQRGNFLEVPTDCPQRDERPGVCPDGGV
jgi:alpha-L-rhamnosidase